MDSLMAENERLKQDISDLNTKMDSILIQKKEEESITSVNLSSHDDPTTNVNLSQTVDKGLEMARDYIKKYVNYSLVFIEGEKIGSTNHCKLYKLLFEGNSGRKIVYLSSVNIGSSCINVVESTGEYSDDWSGKDKLVYYGTCNCQETNKSGDMGTWGEY
jgi:hypothetical protein